MVNKSLSQKGSSHVVIIVILVLVLVGALGFVFWQNFIHKEPIVKQAETLKTQDEPKDEYAGWNTYSNSPFGYSIKYPSDWIVIGETSNDGAYIRNFDPSTRPRENNSYPRDYINLRILSIGNKDANLMGLTAIEWYKTLGVSKTPGAGPGYIYEPSTVSNITVNGQPAKKSITVFTETNEDIFLINRGDSSMYHFNLYPSNASENPTVKKILDSFEYYIQQPTD